MFWFDYSILKYMPDPKRGEIINLGIVIFRDSGIDVRLLQNAAKIRIFDNESNTALLEELKVSLKSISSMANSSQEQYEILKNISSGVFFSSKHSFSLASIGEYESAVKKIFRDLIQPYPSVERKVRSSRFFTKVKSDFKAMNLLANDESDLLNHKVVPNYPIDTGSGLTADFLLKNSRFHMSELIDFNTDDMRVKFRETTLKTMTFISGKRNLKGEVSCYFVYSARSNKEREISSHLNLASDYADEVFNFESAAEKARYYQVIQNALGRELPLQ